MVSELITVALDLLRNIISLRSLKKPELLYYTSNSIGFIITVQGKSTPIYTDSLTIVNKGRSSANDIQIKHAQPLTNVNLNVSPKVPYQIIDEDTIQLNYLHPKESVQISYLYYNIIPPVFYLEFVRSKECLAKQVSIKHSIVYPKWMNWSALILMTFGTIFIISFASYLFTKFIVLKL